jgi:hypothetical protein
MLSPLPVVGLVLPVIVADDPLPLIRTRRVFFNFVSGFFHLLGAFYSGS